jgi:CRISPR-associated protein Cas2
MSAAHWYLFSYDIANHKRLRRIHDLLRDEGIPLQYSVFLVRANALNRMRIADRLQAIMDPRHDDLRVYPLATETNFETLGRQRLNPAMTLLGKRLPHLEREASGNTGI